MIHYLRTLAARLRGLFGKRNNDDREFDEEIQAHLELLTERYIRQGKTRDEAASAARRQFGNVSLLKEGNREMRGIKFIETLLQDLRFGIRIFLKSPGLTAVLVLTIALGIGLNTALFSVVNSLLLNPLSFPDANRLVIAWTRSAKISGDRLGVTPEEFAVWRNQPQSFDGITAAAGMVFNLSGTAEPERIHGGRVSTNFFSVFGIKPALGRDFLPGDDLDGRVVILNQSLWRRQFNADPSLIGKTITLNNQPYTMVGIMAPEFRFPQIFQSHSAPELWTAVQLESFPERGAPFLNIFARLKSGLTIATAQAELNSVERALENAHPQTHSGRSVQLVSLQEQVVGNTRLSLLILFGTVGIVLLIASANVSNLLMARAAARRREISLRLAIGATRLRLIRQLLTEGILLALAGGALGLLFAFLARPLLLSFSGQSIPRADEVVIDTRVLLFTLSLSVIIGLVFSVIPAAQISRLNPNEFLKESSKSGAVGSSSNRLRSSLIVIQVALALVLTIGAGLLTRSFLTLLSVNPGFEPEKVLAFELFLSGEKYRPEQAAGFYRQLTEKLEALPGVEAQAPLIHSRLPAAYSPGHFLLKVDNRLPPLSGASGLSGCDPGFLSHHRCYVEERTNLH
jgi:putative ABC transport system permease protein